jgi:hypothetical protein
MQAANRQPEGLVGASAERECVDVDIASTSKRPPELLRVPGKSTVRGHGGRHVKPDADRFFPVPLSCQGSLG